jgi:hypothetical protein
LLADYPEIAKTMTATLIGKKKHPVIIVDWSKYPNSKEAVIRAAVEIEGRAITLYEERHREKSIGKRGVQTGFLVALQKVLPKDCQPIIITDAGFHNPWFKRIQQMDWHYIGRVRGKKTYQQNPDDKFRPCSKLFKQATDKVKSLGKMLLTETNKFETNFYLIKGEKKGRKRLTSLGKQRRDKDSRDYARAQRDPWLLVSSLAGRNAGKKVITLYKRRMGIEEAFRDMKSSRYGFGLEMGKTRKKISRDILLLIAMLASFFVMVIGIAGEKLKLQYQFQSNSTKDRRVLSVFYLGCQLIRKRVRISAVVIRQVLISLTCKVACD